MQAALQLALRLPAALCVTGGGSCHYRCTVPAAPCGAGVCLCLFLLLNVVYLVIYVKLGLVVGITKQMSNDKENHVDLTLFGRHDIPQVNNSLCLPPYQLIFVYSYY